MYIHILKSEAKNDQIFRQMDIRNTGKHKGQHIAASKLWEKPLFMSRDMPGSYLITKQHRETRSHKNNARHR